MYRFEQKIIEWIESKLYIFAFVAVTMIGFYIRYGLRDFESLDYLGFCATWYDEIKENGGLKGLGIQVSDCNYNMLYQFLIAVLTHIPINSLHAYKILSCIFDFGGAVVVALMVKHFAKEQAMAKIFMAYAVAFLSPLVFLNSAAWAQCDAIYTFFIIACLLALLKDKPALAFIMYGLAFSFKLQAILFLPFLLFVYFARKKFSALHFGWIPLVMVVTSIPCLIAGRSVKELYWIYAGQTGEYFFTHMNYPSFWVLIHDRVYCQNWDAFHSMAMGMTVAVLGVLMVLMLAYKVDLTGKNMLYAAFLLTYAAVLFLPAMHERYGYIYEILAIVIAVVNKKTIPLLAALFYMSGCTYGHYLYETEVNMPVLSLINTATFLLYCYICGREMKGNGGKVTLCGQNTVGNREE